MLVRRVLPKQAREVRSDLKVLGERAGSTTNVLDLGDKGRAVIALQRHLRAAGLYTGKVSGTFDEATQQALMAFQKEKKLTATGALDRGTLKALKTVNRFVKEGFKGDPAKLGQRGSDILSAERRLAKLGFLKQSEADGVFDKDTQKAVQRYAKADPQLNDKTTRIGERGYQEMGKALKSWNHDPLRRRDVTNARGVKRHKQLDEAVEKAVKKAGKEGLALGAKGRAIAWVEKHLEAAGYELGRQDSTFGTRTEAALKQFQAKAGLPATGRLDARTWSKLRGAWFGATGATSPAQREGEKSGAVLRTEKLLKRLGYKELGKIDGFFSENTERAIKRFQKKHKLNVTGAVGGGTLNAIEKAVKKKEGAGFGAKIVKLAQSQLGVRETPMGSNVQKYSKFFGRGAEPWCADFVSWLYTKNGRKLNDPWTPSLLQRIQNGGSFTRTNPKPGMIVIFDWNPGSGVPAEHTGIVEKTFRRNGQLWVQTIEGNSGNMVRRRQYPVRDSQIAGYGYVK